METQALGNEPFEDPQLVTKVLVRVDVPEAEPGDDSEPPPTLPSTAPPPPPPDRV